MNKTDKVKVGIVGEIFVKFSPLGNNNLEQFLISEGAEVVVPGLMGFVNYCIESSIIDNRLYGMHKKTVWIYKLVYKFIHKKELDLIAAIKKGGVFEAPSDFDHTKSLINGYISSGVKMGEGWLLPAEMLELAESGVKNIVCTQPFGCLPNHIVGKGMMKPIKEKNPDVNIVAIDYDAGTTGINQENRIKLMLANAKR
jgi:predicted nucleotide-binding protein (sugar kinase/HSP70/actin superfamily)